VEIETAIRLIEQGVVEMPTPQIWLDLGAGKGLFTKALAGLLGSGSAVHAVDKDQRSLDAIKIQSSSATIIKLRKDFVNENLDWEKWDGVLMANALHFVSDPLSFLLKVKQNLRTNGRLIIVEYNTDTSNPWVPFPISFQSLRKLILAAGFASVTLVDEEPSLFNRGTIYSAVVLLTP
jgi:2-polyprenyl-3-methyl-5-hydroxy-6-metoxy-1,4-benzoquinol methylase